MSEHEVLLCRRECVMLTRNLWDEVGLVNGALGYIENVFFAPSSKLSQLPNKIAVMFEKYCGVLLNKDYQIIVPITPILRGNMRQIPLKMAWALTIHKSQGMTLQQATVDIGDRDR